MSFAISSWHMYANPNPSTSEAATAVVVPPSKEEEKDEKNSPTEQPVQTTVRSIGESVQSNALVIQPSSDAIADFY